MADTTMDPKTIPPSIFQKRAGGKNRVDFLTLSLLVTGMMRLLRTICLGSYNIQRGIFFLNPTISNKVWVVPKMLQMTVQLQKTFEWIASTYYRYAETERTLNSRCLMNKSTNGVEMCHCVSAQRKVDLLYLVDIITPWIFLMHRVSKIWSAHCLRHDNVSIQSCKITKWWIVLARRPHSYHIHIVLVNSKIH